MNPTAAAFHNVTANLAYRLDEEIYYAKYTGMSINSLPGRPGRAIFAGVAVGF